MSFSLICRRNDSGTKGVSKTHSGWMNFSKKATQRMPVGNSTRSSPATSSVGRVIASFSQPAEFANGACIGVDGMGIISMDSFFFRCRRLQSIKRRMARTMPSAVPRMMLAVPPPPGAVEALAGVGAEVASKALGVGVMLVIGGEGVGDDTNDDGDSIDDGVDEDGDVTCIDDPVYTVELVRAARFHVMPLVVASSRWMWNCGPRALRDRTTGST